MRLSALTYSWICTALLLASVSSVHAVERHLPSGLAGEQLSGEQRSGTAPPTQPQLPKSSEPTFRWDADLRFRGAVGIHLKDLQAGQDDRVQGVFQRLRLGSRVSTTDLEARLQLQVSGAFGEKGPGEQPVPVGLQAGSLRWKLPAAQGLTFEVGRMALEFGSGRHIARYDFHDEGNAYDGFRLQYSAEPWLRVDTLGVKLRRTSAQPDKERTLFGLYLVGKPFKPVTTDVYLLILRDGGDQGRIDLQTMGLRLEFKPNPHFRVEFEGAVQFGSRQPVSEKAPLDHLAGAMAAELEFAGRLGVQLAGGLRAQQYSGDDGTEANLSRAWRPLYPDVVRHVGLLQLFAQSGLRQLGAWLRVGDSGRLYIEADARLNASPGGAQAPGFSRPKLGKAGDGWVSLGSEVDVRLVWRALSSSRLMLATGMFAPSSELAAKIGGRLARQVLLQWTSHF
ncbi:MAG: alginate export family protein [Myxococcales bacterium]|nr:alginate export family protein [Myxococcales bacterium]